MDAKQFYEIIQIGYLSGVSIFQRYDFLSQLLIMTNGGDVSLLDFLTGQVLCHVKVPPPYIVTSFDLDNMLSLAASGQQMLVKG